jgi:very-short-patch-repair endonuclease
MSARPIAQLRRQQVLAERAAEMRTAPTRSEAALWEVLRGKAGFVVRRQVVIGQYVVDFLVPACRLVIEVDGGYHAARRVADAGRERALRRLGYRVLRLEAELVLGAPQEAVARVRAALAG